MADAAVIVFWLAMIGLGFSAVFCLIELLIPPAWLYEEEDEDA